MVYIGDRHGPGSWSYAVKRKEYKNFSEKMEVPDLKNNEKAKKLDFPKNRGGKGGLFEQKSKKLGWLKNRGGKGGLSNRKKNKIRYLTCKNMKPQKSWVG